MIFQVIPMYRQGVRQPRELLRGAAAVVGRLKVEDWREGNAENRALRVARLFHPTQSYFPELLLPLFDPVLIRCDRRGIVLSGVEFDARPNREVASVTQAWWLRERVNGE
jgi:hypothetical protein